MSEVVSRESENSLPNNNVICKGEFLFFNNLAGFSKAVEELTGVVFDFASVASLSSNFLGQPSDRYMILNVKEHGVEDTNNLLFLTEDTAFLYSKKPPVRESFKIFDKICSRPFGRSTVMAFLTLSKVMDSFKPVLESYMNITKELDQEFDYTRYRSAVSELERINDALEELHDIVLRLQERTYKQVETRYIAFDYSVLIAEGLSLEGRSRRRLNILKELARDKDAQASNELNKRIERLNDVVKRLTAITVILMIPTLIASHFGMNFAYMPELRVPWAYPVVIGAQVVLMVIGLWVFRRIGWL